MESELNTLTKADIKALRKADSICFRFDRKENISVIDCIKKSDDKNPFEQCHRIEVYGGVRSQNKFVTAFYLTFRRSEPAFFPI